MTDEQKAAREAIAVKIDAALKDLEDRERLTREQQVALGQQMDELRTTFGPYGRGWAGYVKGRWKMTDRMARRYIAVSRKLSEPGAERFEGKSLAYIERGGPSKPRPRGKSSKPTPQGYAHLCPACQEHLRETAFDREAV